MSWTEDVQDKLEKVRDLHVQVRICTDVRTGAWRWECAECGDAGEDGEWPCDTAKAIEREQA